VRKRPPKISKWNKQPSVLRRTFIRRLNPGRLLQHKNPTEEHSDPTTNCSVSAFVCLLFQNLRPSTNPPFTLSSHGSGGDVVLRAGPDVHRRPNNRVATCNNFGSSRPINKSNNCRQVQTGDGSLGWLMTTGTSEPPRSTQWVDNGRPTPINCLSEGDGEKKKFGQAAPTPLIFMFQNKSLFSYQQPHCERKQEERENIYLLHDFYSGRLL
jgi:hypothetical protein